MHRQFSPVDHLIVQGGRSPARVHQPGPGGRARPTRPDDLPDMDLETASREHVAGLMRINHAGEVCAQALYAGQAATARSTEVRTRWAQRRQKKLTTWPGAKTRLDELDSKPSMFNPCGTPVRSRSVLPPAWPGDGWSLGFVRETENQVEAHLEEHLGQLPADDLRSNAILAQMKEDEARTCRDGRAAGAL